MNKWAIFTDSEIMKLLQQAIELRNGKYIKELKEETTRRNREK